MLPQFSVLIVTFLQSKEQVGKSLSVVYMCLRKKKKREKKTLYENNIPIMEILKDAQLRGKKLSLCLLINFKAVSIHYSVASKYRV